MDEDLSNRSIFEWRFTSSKPFILIVAFVAGSLFILNVSAWFPYRGGFISIVSGVLDTNARANSVDIDPSGLDLPVEYIVLLLIILILYITKADFRRKWIAYFTIVVPFIAAFIFSNTFEGATITDYMVYHGYSQCPSRDRPAEKGRIVVWFDVYALSLADCSIEPSNTHQPTKG